MLGFIGSAKRMNLSSIDGHNAATTSIIPRYNRRAIQIIADDLVGLRWVGVR